MEDPTSELLSEFSDIMTDKVPVLIAIHHGFLQQYQRSNGRAALPQPAVLPQRLSATRSGFSPPKRDTTAPSHTHKRWQNKSHPKIHYRFGKSANFRLFGKPARPGVAGICTLGTSDPFPTHWGHIVLCQQYLITCPILVIKILFIIRMNNFNTCTDSIQQTYHKVQLVSLLPSLVLSRTSKTLRALLQNPYANFLFSLVSNQAT